MWRASSAIKNNLKETSFYSSRHTAVTEEEVGTPENPQKRLVYQHKIEPGVTKIEHYGLALAAKTNLPEDTVKLAMELAELISSNTIVSRFKLERIESYISPVTCM